ncbi:MAG TPA: hypothetical protein VFL83_16050 [Anaeromyxobacter sp.]|nr:hypothetical protein [Anaeromyxobacter sp.]
MPMRLGSHKELVAELPWLGVAALALVGTLSVEHFVVHRQIVLPTLELTTRPPFWMYAAMIAPELVVFFAAGYRLRTWLALVMYAGIGGLVRSAYHLALQLAQEPGHQLAGHERLSEFAMTTPVVAVGYMLVLAVAAWSGEDERRLSDASGT